VYCFDTDVLSAVIGRNPPFHLVRRVATVPEPHRFTTSITLGEMLYGAARIGDELLVQRIHEIVGSQRLLPFGEAAARVYGPLRAGLESDGRRLAEPDLRIASIALSRDLTLVTGDVRHFERVPSLRVEDWLAG
jgi:tRNA(fMet)-specific endonuclease VapC